MEQFEILKDLVEFNTIKDKENKQIINYISNIDLQLNIKENT